MTEKKNSYHHGNLRQALVEASLKIVAQEGVDRLTMAQAAKTIGVSSGAPYRHFKDRDELLREVAQAASALLNQAIGQAASQATSMREAFLETGIALVSWAAQNPRWYQLLMDPEYTDFNAEPAEGDNFWRRISQKFNSEDMAQNDPVLGELAGRSMAFGMAGLFASGVFEQVGISRADAERLTRLVFRSIGGPEPQ